MNSSSFINEIKQLFQVYLISVFIRNFVVDMQTKNVKKYFDMLCFAAHLFYSIFQASSLRERERERERERQRQRQIQRDVCVCVSVLSAVEGQVNPRDGSIKLNIAPSSPQQPIKQNNTKPNISLPPQKKKKKKIHTNEKFKAK